MNKKFINKLLDNINTSVEKMEKEMIEFNKKNNNKKKKSTKYAFDQHWYGLQGKSEWFLFKPYLGRQGGAAGRSSIMGHIDDFTNNIRIYKIFV